MTSSPDSLVDSGGNPVGPAPAASEYTPTLTFLMNGFREFSLTATAGFHLFGFSGFLDPFVSVTSTLIGNFVVDYWAPHIDLTATVLVTFGFFNAADYTDNTPIHLIPFGSPDIENLHDAVYTFVGFHHFDDHFDPLA
jgi:hypothetical protein